MLLTEVILNIRQNCPIFGQRVAGTQGFIAASEQTNLVDVPCCFVVPMYTTAKARTPVGYSQEITERFATIVIADNSLDKLSGKGLAAEIILSQATQQLCAALLMWTSAAYPTMGYAAFARAQHLFMNNSRIYHQFEWTADYYYNANPTTEAAYIAIQNQIMGMFPTLTAETIKAAFVTKNPYIGAVEGPSPIDVPEGVSAADYNMLLEITGAIPPTWIKHIESNSSLIVDRNSPEAVNAKGAFFGPGETGE